MSEKRTSQGPATAQKALEGATMKLDFPSISFLRSIAVDKRFFLTNESVILSHVMIEWHKFLIFQEHEYPQQYELVVTKDETLAVQIISWCHLDAVKII